MLASKTFPSVNGCPSFGLKSSLWAAESGIATDNLNVPGRAGREPRAWGVDERDAERLGGTKMALDMIRARS